MVSGRITGRNSRYIFAALLMTVSLFTSMMTSLVSDTASAQSPGGKKIQEVATGYDSACAVVESWAYCWGANDYGQLGKGGQASTAAVPTPVAVSSNKTEVPGPEVCTSWILFFCTASVPGVPKDPASAMAGLEVEKISVGVTHACAVASAKVYCWGNNSKGQLGNRKTGSYAAAPVRVDVQSKDETNKPKSALAQKEVVDVTAGEDFSCALASDGTVACWGAGADGRLGIGTVTDVNYPKAVVATEGTPLFGKKGVKLARASETTMCVLAVNDADFTSGSTKGNPYCWGLGIGNGTIPGPKQVTVTCGKTSPTTRPTVGSATTVDTYFSSATPIQISNTQLFTHIDGNGYLTGHADNSRAYYWGLHGYRETRTFASYTSCSVPCTAMSEGSVKLARRTQHNTNGTSTKVSNSVKPGQQKDGSIVAGGKKNTTCTSTTHYGYTANSTAAEIGKMTPTVPHSSSLNQNTLGILAGDIEDGLFCATKTSGGAFCDANGGSVKEGQTGSGYTERCVTTGVLFWTTTTCDPAPTGPQQVVSSGWLSGKTIQQLSTGQSGYTCALANNSIGCWGLNTSGQLGTGDVVNKNVPTGVKL